MRFFSGGLREIAKRGAAMAALLACLLLAVWTAYREPVFREKLTKPAGTTVTEAATETGAETGAETWEEGPLPEPELPVGAEQTDEVVYADQKIGEASAAGTSLPRATSFSVVIPSSFHADAVTGRYVCNRYPLDAANITVTSTTPDEEALYTNAEKRELPDTGETHTTVLSRDYASMTAGDFESTVNQTLPEGMTLKVTEFANIRIQRESDGRSYPGFRIRTEISGAPKPILQEIYMVLSKDRVFTVTYARASDDEFEETFRQSAETIAVY